MARIYSSVILLALALTTSANATTLHYVGPTFAQNILIGDDADAHVEAHIAFSNPLIPGSVVSLSSIASYSIDSAGRTITDRNATYAFAEFTIGPDGLPSDWGFGAEAQLEGNSNPEQIATHAGTTNMIFTGTRTFDTDALHIDDLEPNKPQGAWSGNGAGLTDLLGGTGTWTTVPEPCGVMLLGHVITTLLSTRRRLSIY